MAKKSLKEQIKEQEEIKLKLLKQQNQSLANGGSVPATVPLSQKKEMGPMTLEIVPADEKRGTRVKATCLASVVPLTYTADQFRLLAKRLPEVIAYCDANGL